MKTYRAIVIDYGHGEETPGKRYTFTDHGDLICREYKTNRMTAARLIPMLLRAGFRVFDAVARREWTRKDVEAEDCFCWRTLHQGDVSLKARVWYANTIKGSFLLSLHSNAVGYSNKGKGLRPRGGIMYTSPGETASDAIAESLYDAFARAFETEPVFMRKGDTSDGDHDYEARLYMLTKTRGPAVLGEMLFFTSIDDARYLLSPEGQDVIAGAYFDGVAGYLEPFVL